MGTIIHDIGTAIGTSTSDWLLFIMLCATFLWYRASLRSTIRRFEGFLSSLTKEFTLKIDSNAAIVKDHLDAYNITHEKSWTALRDLVQELKAGKVWKEEYLLQVSNLKDKGEVRDERIKDLDERIKCIERARRKED